MSHVLFHITTLKNHEHVDGSTLEIDDNNSRHIFVESQCIGMVFLPSSRNWDSQVDETNVFLIHIVYTMQPINEITQYDLMTHICVKEMGHDWVMACQLMTPNHYCNISDLFTTRQRGTSMKF